MFKVAESLPVPVLPYWGFQTTGHRKLCKRCQAFFYGNTRSLNCPDCHPPVFRRCKKVQPDGSKCNARLMAPRIQFCDTCAGRETI
jgi:hypothetical protein